MKYNVSVGAIFKNESLNIEEWVLHYLNRGVEHFYLIDDGSDDNYLDKIERYIKDNTITLLKNDIPKIPRISNRQGLCYNKFLTPVIVDSKWFIVCDLDEFLYSPKTLNLIDIFNKYQNYNLLTVNWINFNSNSNDKHPDSIVSSCTKRIGYDQEIFAPSPWGWRRQTMQGRKYIINSTISRVKSLGLHDCQMESNTGYNKVKEVSYSAMGEDFDLAINHYTTQSREFWEKSKMKRGDADNWHADDARNWEFFNALDVGDIEDTRLIVQNEKYGIKYIRKNGH